MAAIGDSFFLFEIQKLKRALRKLDDKEVISTKIISEIIESSALKLEKGGYEGTAEDLRVLANTVNTGFTGVSVTPTSTPTGTGVSSWIATQTGTYTNFGGVVVAVNSFAVISRNEAGVFSISQTALDLTSYAKTVDVNKINTWTATTFTSGSQVNYLGKDWTSNAATLSTDIPGTSSKWVERLSGYVQVNKNGENLHLPITINDEVFLDLNTNGYFNLGNAIGTPSTTLVNNSSYRTSLLIDVSVAKNFTYYGLLGGSDGIAFFDSSKNYLGLNFNGSNSAGTNLAAKAITFPTAAKYALVSSSTSSNWHLLSKLVLLDVDSTIIEKRDTKYILKKITDNLKAHLVDKKFPVEVSTSLTWNSGKIDHTGTILGDATMSYSSLYKVSKGETITASLTSTANLPVATFYDENNVINNSLIYNDSGLKQIIFVVADSGFVSFNRLNSQTVYSIGYSDSNRSIISTEQENHIEQWNVDKENGVNETISLVWTIGRFLTNRKVGDTANSTVDSNYAVSQLVYARDFKKLILSNAIDYFGSLIGFDEQKKYTGFFVSGKNTINQEFTIPRSVKYVMFSAAKSQTELITTVVNTIVATKRKYSVFSAQKFYDDNFQQKYEFDYTGDVVTIKSGFKAKLLDAKLSNGSATIPIIKQTSSLNLPLASYTDSKCEVIVFPDKDNNICVGYRELDWLNFVIKTNVLPVQFGKQIADNHNYYEISITNDGYILISGNMHNNISRCALSRKPYDISSFVYLPFSTDTTVTYPKFLKHNTENKIIAFWREGGSGNGDYYFNVLDGATKIWGTKVKIIDGLASSQSFYGNFLIGTDNVIKIIGGFRANALYPFTTSGMYYMETADFGATWRTSTGTSLVLPLTNLTMERVVNVASESGHVNQGAAILDANNKLHSVIWQDRTDLGVRTSQFHHITNKSGVWTKTEFTSFTGNNVPEGEGYINSYTSWIQDLFATEKGVYLPYSTKDSNKMTYLINVETGEQVNFKRHPYGSNGNGTFESSSAFLVSGKYRASATGNSGFLICSFKTFPTASYSESFLSRIAIDNEMLP